MPDALDAWRRRYPSPLLEAGLAAAILVAVVAAGTHLPFAGARFLAVVGAYAAGRIALSATRAGGLRSVRVNLAVSAGLLALAAAGLVGLAAAS
jgi:hypothetical protein